MDILGKGSIIVEQRIYIVIDLMCGTGAGHHDSQIGGGGPGADGKDHLPVYFPCHEETGNP